MRATWFTYKHPRQLETSVGTEVRDDISFCQEALVYFYDGKDYEDTISNEFYLFDNKRFQNDVCIGSFCKT